jgi:anti-anti-sigma factor
MTVTAADGTVLIEISRHTENSAEHPGSATPSPVVVVDVVGDVDVDTTAVLHTALRHAIERNRHVCCDLSRVAFLSAAGVNTILAALRHADSAGCAFTVRGAHGVSAHVFKITGLDALFATRA